MTAENLKSGRGILIVLEGLDRAGKTTQCQLLYEKLTEKLGTGRVRVQKVPDRSTQIGQAINSYLVSQTHLPDQAIHLLFSANRWELRDSILSSLATGQTVILDRYVPSGVAYSLAKEVPSMSLEWCLAPDRGLPQPDVTIFLDIDPDSAKLQTARADFGRERYEVTEFQAKVRKNFKTILGDDANPGALRMGKVVTIDACQELDAVAAGIWDAITDLDIGDKEIEIIQ
ncbi:thymidylate kinase-domain-containing protein [Lipomyces kononenkoae]|uniref:Thymidylate kinase-domain-containing protein n=1 Tax=Lipomyces kononenkoae TaxID=34357 RepID=A0ACC3T731_LIPKO